MAGRWVSPGFIIRHCGDNHNTEFLRSTYNLFIWCGGVSGIIDYGPLWETMRRNGVTQYQLLKSGIDNKTLDSLKKNKNITLLTVEKLCNIIGCLPNDIVQFKK